MKRRTFCAVFTSATLITSLAGAEPLIEEHFNYTPGTALKNSPGWKYENSGNYYSNMSGNLSYDGLANSSGNKVTAYTNIWNINDYAYSNVNVGALSSINRYDSMLVKLDDIAALPTFGDTDTNRLVSLGILNNAAFVVRKNASDSGKVDIGVKARPGAVDIYLWHDNGGVGYDPNQTFLFVSRTTTNQLTTGDRYWDVWINPSSNTFSAAEGSAPPPTFSTGRRNGNYNNKIIIRQNFHVNYEVDEWRVGSSWAEVTPPAANEIMRPLNYAPANEEVTPLTPTLFASEYSGSPANTHTASMFYVHSLLSGAAWTFSTGAVTNLAIPPATLAQSSLYAWRVRYLGLASSSPWSYETFFRTANTGTPRLIAYDGVAYDETNSIAGLAGGLGWAVAWTNLNYGVGVRAGGLGYDGLTVTGSTFITADPAASPLRATRTIAVGDGMAHLLTPAGKFGRADSTNWLAYLVAAGEDFTNGEYGVELYDGATRRAYVTKSQDLPRWWLSMPSTNGAGCAFDKFSTNIQWLVIRIVHSASGASNGTAHLWTNPLVSETMPGDGDAAIAVYAVRPFAFDKLTVFANAWPPSGSGMVPTALLDEVRFGEDWRNMFDVPIPEPAAGIMWLLVAMSNLRLRSMRYPAPKDVTN